MAEYEIERDTKTGQFIPGNNGGPGRGARRIDSPTFIGDMEQAWLKHGRKLIARVIKDDPSTALRVFAAMVPRELLVRSMARERVIDPDVARDRLRGLIAQREAEQQGD